MVFQYVGHILSPVTALHRRIALIANVCTKEYVFDLQWNYWSKYGSKSSLEIGVGGLRSTTFVSIYQNVRLGL